MSILQSVDHIVTLFESSGCQYVVIGGIAVLLHGGRASTIDFDLYILAGDTGRVESHLQKHGGVVTMRGEHQLRMTLSGIQVYILESDAILGKSIFARALRRKLVNAECKLATPEDLVILKTLADRPIDRRDIAELREIFAGSLDESYITSMLDQFRSV